MSCANQIKICAFSHGVCDYAGHEDDCPNCHRCSGDSNVPTIAELRALYQEAAVTRRLQTEQISPREVRLSVSCLNRFLEECGVSDSDPTTGITRRRLAQFAEILTYTPHKTRLKSGRVVRIEVSDVDWYHLCRLKELPLGGGEYVIPGGGAHYGIRQTLNRQMRSLGFTGSKGIYELRKACGDVYARKLGVDMARAILGHRLVTGATAHYVDGSGPIVPTIWG